MSFLFHVSNNCILAISVKQREYFTSCEPGVQVNSSVSNITYSQGWAFPWAMDRFQKLQWSR